MRRPQTVALRPLGLQPSMLALAMALSVGVVGAAPGEAWAAKDNGKGSTSASNGKGSSNNGGGNGAGSSTGTSSGNNGNDKGVGNAGGSNGNVNASSNGNGKSNSNGNGNASPSGDGNSSSSSSGGSTSNGVSNSSANSNSGGYASNGSAGGNSNAAPSAAASLPVCALSDLSVGAAGCSGYFAGNLLNNSPADLTTQTTGLDSLGLTWDGSLAEPQLTLSGASVNFATALHGLTYVGVHYGAGANSPSPHSPGGVTAFYRFDAGAGLDSFLLTLGSTSAARLYATGPAPIVAPPSAPLPPLEIAPPAEITLPVELTPPMGVTPPFGADTGIAVPEPTTWALMILGFGAAGAVLRRRRALTPA